MEDLTKLENGLSFALQIGSDEMPTRVFVAQRNNIRRTKHREDQHSTTIFALSDDWKSATELEKCTLAMDMFFLICLSQCLGFKMNLYVKESFAAEMDQLPKRYALLWQAGYDGVNRNVIALAE